MEREAHPFFCLISHVLLSNATLSLYSGIYLFRLLSIRSNTSPCCCVHDIRYWTQLPKREIEKRTLVGSSKPFEPCELFDALEQFLA